jgi:hypothetical protein
VTPAPELRDRVAGPTFPAVVPQGERLFQNMLTPAARQHRRVTNSRAVLITRRYEAVKLAVLRCDKYLGSGDRDRIEGGLGRQSDR